jgi:hypothetical protein
VKSLSSFMSRILPHVSGCPDVLAEEALLDTAIEFCEKTLVVQKTLPPVSTLPEQINYTLTPPTHQAVLLVLAAWFKGALMEPVASQEVLNVQGYTTTVPGYEHLFRGDPTQYYWTAPNTLCVFPIPDDTDSDSILVRVATKPSRSATQLEDVLFDDWVDALVAGTLARLHATKDQAWSSSDRSLLRSREFRLAVQRARMEGATGRVRTTLSVKMRRF